MTEPRNFSQEELSKQREPPSFESLMRLHGARVYTLAVRLTGTVADGQDLAQETFIRAYRAFNGFRGEAEFGTWVYRICMNLWKNRVRYEKRRFFWNHFSLDGRGAEDEAPREIPAADPPLERPVEAEERRRHIQQALDRLDPESRAVIILRDMEDRSYEEIASLLKLPLGTVKSRLARAREQLRGFLKAYWAS